MLAPERLDRPFGDPLVSRLFPPLATGVHWDLDRSVKALAALGNPHLAYRTIHVGGTNGKGSVTSTVASVLKHSGLRTGAYTSPHLCSFRERMLVDGRPLTEEVVLGCAETVLDPVLEYGLTFFEAITVLAMYAFAEEGAEVAVMEVGLGGRLDATNVVQPEVSAVTNVAMDHAEYLGDTLAAIASEKAGIMKAGVPFLTTEANPDILDLFRSLAEKAGAPFHAVDPGELEDVAVARDRTCFTTTTDTWGRLDVETPLIGLHQAANAALAIGLLEYIDESVRPSRAALLDGIAAVKYHGRDEVRQIAGSTWILDVAHNVAGIRSLVDTLDRLDLPRPHVGLIGVQGDKDWPRMLPELLACVDGAVLTQPPTVQPERRWNPEAALEEVGSGEAVEVEHDFVAAMRRARERAGGGTVVVTGSVHTVGSAMTRLGLDPLGE